MFSYQITQDLWVLGFFITIAALKDVISGEKLLFRQLLMMWSVLV